MNIVIIGPSTDNKELLAAAIKNLKSDTQVIHSGLDHGVGHSIGVELVIESNRDFALYCRKQEEKSLGIPPPKTGFERLCDSMVESADSMKVLAETFGKINNTIIFEPTRSKYFDAPKHNYKRK